MSKNSESLILKEQADAAAPFLFSQSTIDALTEAERRGEYTLERVREKKPELIDEVIKLRGQFIGQQRIAKILGVHHRTIAAIDQAYPERIEIERRKRIAMLRNTADSLVELVADNPESVPANVRCLAASQLYDKAQLLDGGATANLAVDLRTSVNISASFSKLDDMLRKISALHEDGTIATETLKDLCDSALDACASEIGIPGRTARGEYTLEPMPAR
jgi:hypothetical protein